MAQLSEDQWARIRAAYEEEPSEHPPRPVYPGLRHRVDEARNDPPEVFERYETTQGYVSLGDNNSVVIDFSEVADHPEIFVLDNDAVIQFVGEEVEVRPQIRITAGNFYNPKIKARKVVARNASAGLVARIQVVGKWASQ